MRFRFDPVSGAMYVRVREGVIEETIPLAEPGFGASVDVDREGNVMGLEFLSLEEFTEIIARSGGTLEIPDVVKDAETPPSREERQGAESHHDTTHRTDEVINVSGHRLSTVEIENALVNHEAVAEAAVVGVEDEDKGQAPVAFVILEGENEYSEDLEKDLINEVADKAGKISRPDRVYAVQDLPKTNSGKIMRHILELIAEGEKLGGISALEDFSNASSNDPSIAGTIRHWPRDTPS